MSRRRMPAYCLTTHDHRCVNFLIFFSMPSAALFVFPGHRTPGEWNPGQQDTDLKLILLLLLFVLLLLLFICCLFIVCCCLVL